MDFIAGVDGGGTKTKVVCASPEGKVLDTAVFGPFNMNSCLLYTSPSPRDRG